MWHRRVLFLVVLVLSSAITPASGSGIRVKTELEPPVIASGDTAVFTVVMEWEGQSGNGIEIVHVEAPGLELFELQEVLQEGDVLGLAHATVTVKRFQYRLHALGPGEARIGRVSIQYRDGGATGETSTLETEPLTVRILSPLKKWVFITWKGVLAVLGVGAGVVMAYVLLRFYQRKVPRDTADLNAGGPAVEERALERLKETEKYRIEGDRSGYYRSLYDIALEYGGDKYGVDLQKRETGDGRKAAIPEEFIALVEELYALGESVRFGGKETTPQEDELVRSRLRRFLKSALPKIREEDSIKFAEK